MEFSGKLSVFAESGYLKTLFAESDINAQSKKLAVYQFLRLTQSLEKRFTNGEKSPMEQLLVYVKKLAHFNEDKNYAQIPTEAENLDAVRLLTVHSAKGLEFPVVFLPFLGKGKIPSNRKAQICPESRRDDRGRNRFSRRGRRMSVFRRRFTRARFSASVACRRLRQKSFAFFRNARRSFARSDTYVTDDFETIEIEKADISDAPRRQFYAAELDRYLRCGRDYFYSNVLGLKAAGDQTVYLTISFVRLRHAPVSADDQAVEFN